MRNAFTLIELIFVIVILGILAAVAIPKLMGTRDDAVVAKNLQYVGSIATEIPAYVFSQMQIERDLSKMSNTVAVLLNENKATIDTQNASVKLKVGTDSDCIEFKLVGNTNEYNLTLTLKSNPADEICKRVQQNINLNDYPIPLRGELVKF